MEINQNESLVEIAARVMKTKKKPKTFKDIANESLQIKGIKTANESLRAQFQMDFMLSGYFVCCGEDKNGLKLWDLKARQPSTLLDKDGNYLEDLYENDEEVIKNELKEDYNPSDDKSDDYLNDDDEEHDEADDIEAELGLIEETDAPTTTEVVVEEAEDEEAEEAEDEVEIELKG